MLEVGSRVIYTSATGRRSEIQFTVEQLGKYKAVIRSPRTQATYHVYRCQLELVTARATAVGAS